MIIISEKSHPYSTNKTRVKSCRRLLSIDIKIFSFTKLVPGKKCCVCFCERLESHKEDNDLNDPDFSESVNVDADGDGFKSSLSLFGFSPIKLSIQEGAPKKKKKKCYRKRKFGSMKEKLPSSFSDILSNNNSNSC